METMLAPGSNRLDIIRMYCIPTEHTYGNMYQRSFSIGLTPGETESLYTYFQGQNVANNSPLGVTSAARQIGNIVKLSPVPTGRVDIPNGWAIQRITFILVVDEYINNASSLTHYIQGYSEHYDPSYSGALDSTVIYFINSITTIIRNRDLVTNQIVSRVSCSYNIISDPTGNISYQKVTDPNTNLELIRPSDIITNLHAQSMYGDLQDGNINVKTSSISDGGNLSSKSNSDGLKYFTTIANSIITGKCITAGHATPDAVLHNAGGLVAEEAISNNSFMYELARLTGNMEPNFFTLDLLSRMDPGINSKITLVTNRGIAKQDYSTALDTNESEGMLNYSIENQVAQTFINSLTANMSENLVNVISGSATNINGQPFVTISNLESFLEGVDITPYGNRIVQYISNVIFPQLSQNNLMLLSIAFNCDLLADTVVSISVENQPNIVYRVPTFADSLYSPILTNSATKDELIGNFETITDTIMVMGPGTDIGVYNGY